MRKLYLFILSITFINCFGQYTAKDSVYLFWQESQRIRYGDYQGSKAYTNDSVVVAQIGIWTALDFPENKNAKTKKVHIYIAPVFDRKTSYAPVNDSSQLAKKNIYFDIAEVCARFAREKLTSILDTLQSYENLPAIFRSVTKEMYEKSLRTNRQFQRNYFKEKNQKSVHLWREKLDVELAATSKWATTDTDCYRFIKNLPIEKGYAEDESCRPHLVRAKYERVLMPDIWHAGYYQVSRFSEVRK